jgi:predicted RNase H-like nuclease (RuvC/YqgF family)
MLMQRESSIIHNKSVGRSSTP